MEKEKDINERVWLDTLVFTSLKQYHQGEYSCLASNGYDDDKLFSKSMTLNIAKRVENTEEEQESEDEGDVNNVKKSPMVVDLSSSGCVYCVSMSTFFMILVLDVLYLYMRW